MHPLGSLQSERRLLMKDYVFISGCPRSGTTAMTHIFNWAPQCFVGFERFASLFARDPAAFTPALFEPERLNTFVDRDCAYPSYEAQNEHGAYYANKAAVPGIPQAQHVGDKNPKLWQNFDVFLTPAWADKKVRIFHIIRSVYDVSASYQVRFDNASDAWTADFKTGVTDWMTSVRNTAAFMRKLEGQSRDLKLLIVDYDRLFSPDQDTFIASVGKMYEQAELELSPGAVEGLKHVFNNGQQRRSARKPNPEVASAVASMVSEEVMDLHATLAEKSLI